MAAENNWSQRMREVQTNDIVFNSERMGEVQMKIKLVSNVSEERESS